MVPTEYDRTVDITSRPVLHFPLKLLRATSATTRSINTLIYLLISRSTRTHEAHERARARASRDFYSSDDFEDAF